MKRRDLNNARNSKAHSKAQEILKAIVGQKIDPVIGVKQLYTLKRSNPGMLRELNPFFELPNLDPENPQGQAGLKRNIVALAKKAVLSPAK